MGNTASTAVGASRVPIGLGNLLGEVDAELQYDKSMGTSRFLKAIRARHRYGLVVVKAYIKPDAALSLQGLVRRLRVEREALADVPQILAYQRFVETATVGYLIRQWLASNLYDRISTRPFLTNIEKKWITYQLLHAMRDARQRNIPHGDLKCGNILVTASLSVYVTDFAASFKPAYLPLNDPADFNFFFGTSGRRTCYVAPERFYASESELKLHAQTSSLGADPAAELSLGVRNMGYVSEAMDVFSLGCVIAELWRDGAPTFTLTQLFKYREGNFDVEPALAEVGDAAIRDMVRTMISLKPDDRLTFDAHLSNARGTAFPESFYTFIHRYLVDLQRVTPQHAAALASSTATSRPAPSASSASTAAGAASEAGAASRPGVVGPSTVRDEADDRIERLFEEWSVIVKFLDDSESSQPTQGTFAHDDASAQDGATSPQRFHANAAFREGVADVPCVAGDTEAAERVLPVQLSIPGMPSQVVSRSKRAIDEDGPALLMLSPILANLRGALRPSSKVHALDLLLHLASRWLTDETILDRALPYTVALLDDVPVVRTAAVRACTQLLMLVETLTPANAIVFQEYIVPHLRRLAMDPSPEVRAMFAECIVELCRVGDRFLQLAQSMRAAGMFALEGEAPGAEADGGAGAGESDDFLNPSADEASYDVQLAALRSFFQEQVTTLLTDPSSTVKRALLSNIAPLCSFFGSAPTNDVLLSHMITYLNDRSWLLRHAFFSAIVGVARVAGQRSVEQYILPLMLQALSDPEESVVLRVLEGLSELVNGEDSPLLSRAKVLDVVGATAGFLCHPNHWLRLNAANLCSLASRHLSHSDIWALIYPSVRPLLRSDVQDLDELQLVSMAKAPLSRPVLQAAVLWAARVNKTSFWKPPPDAKQKAGLGNGIAREGLSLLAGRSGKAVTRTPVPRTEEDDGYLDKLRALGMGPDDEVKLVALRDYIWKLARQVNTSRTSSTTSADDATPQAQQVGVGVQPLDGITPLTIFFTTAARTAPTVGGPASDGHSIAPDSVRSSVRSSFSSNVARRRLAGSRVPSEVASLSPLAELRRRMEPNPSSRLAMPATPGPLVAANSSTGAALRPPNSPPTSISGAQGRLGLGKAAPAIAATSTNATGTMSDLAARLRTLDSAHESSGNATPVDSANQTTVHGGTAQDKGMETNYAVSFSSNYAGDDPYVKAHLEAVYLATFRDRPPAWGPHIASGGAAFQRKGMRTVSSSSARTVASGSSNRRPEGNLVAYFTEHSGPITALAVSPDHVFFASGSEDGSVKVWDTARLEKNVTSRSRATYAGQKGGITALISLDGTHCVASAAVDGSVHVLRIDVAAASSLPKYGKLRLISNFQLSSPGEHALCLLQSSASAGGLSSTAAATSADMSSTSLILGTSRSRITILDLRTMQVLQTLRNPSHFGPITCMCTDKKNIWLLVGTLGGVMALWDLRFSLLLKSWRVGSDVKAEASLDGIVRVTRVTPHPSKGKGRQVLIAYERMGSPQAPTSAAPAKSLETLVEVWDIDKGVQVESFQTDSTSSSGTVTSASRQASSTSTIAPSLRRTDSSSPAHGEDLGEASSGENAPTQGIGAAGPQVDGLVGAADAIARLVRLHEATEVSRNGDRAIQDERSSGDEEEVIAAATSLHAQLQPPRSATAGVKAMLVGNEGYSSSSAAAAGQVSGGWLDAGKLAAEGDTAQEATGSTGPAGWMICAGEDRCIRFWDMGRTERSVCFGTVDQRSEFKFQPHSSVQGAAHHVHHLHSTSASAFSTARAQLRSPLLTQQQTGQTQALMRAHKDSISALAVLSQPFRCIVAGDAQGGIRVWE